MSNADVPHGGDSGGFHLRYLTDSQAVEIVDDWIARTRIYCMSNQFGDKSKATTRRWKSLDKLKALHDLSKSETAYHATGERKALFAMYAADKTTVLVLAGGGMLDKTTWNQFHGERLVVTHVVVNPMELNQEDSTVALKMEEGLGLLARSTGAHLQWPED